MTRTNESSRRAHPLLGVLVGLTALVCGCPADGGSSRSGPTVSADPIRPASEAERAELTALFTADASDPAVAEELVATATSAERAPALRVAALQRLAAGAPESFLEAAEPPITEAVAGQADRSGRFVADNALALAVEAGEGGAALLDRVLTGGSAEARRLGELRMTLEARAGEGGER